MLAAKPPLYRVIRLAELPQFVGLKRTQIHELIERDEFPRPIALSDSGRAKAWLEHEIVAWQQQRVAQRDERIRRVRRKSHADA